MGMIDEGKEGIGRSWLGLDDGIQVRLQDRMVVDFVNWNYIDPKLSIDLLSFEMISFESNFWGWALVYRKFLSVVVGDIYWDIWSCYKWDRRYSDPRIALLFFSFSNEIYYYGNVLKGVEKMIGRKLLGVDFFSFNFDEWLLTQQ